jgi:hypothetical protein
MPVSVVIPLYNKARHIRRSVESVLGQTYQDFELLVVDDGSTDGSGDVVRGFQDPRIRLIVQDNAGVSAARNRGIQAATHEMIAFLDADDEWLPGFLETVTGLCARHPEAGMYATAYRYNQGGDMVSPRFEDCCALPQGGILDDYFRAALGAPPVCSTAVMIPKRILIEAGLFPLGMRWGEDLHTWEQIALRYRVAWSPLECAVYHLSADNRACIHERPPRKVATSAIEEFLLQGHQPVSSLQSVEEYLVSWRLRFAWDCHLKGNKQWALSHLARTSRTARYKRKRLILTCLLRVPPPVLRTLRSFKTALTRK